MKLMNNAAYQERIHKKKSDFFYDDFSEKKYDEKSMNFM